eukprot:7001182-Ditylum_brightwellii.AAC.1
MFENSNCPAEDNAHHNGYFAIIMHNSSFKDMHDSPHSSDEGLFNIPVTAVYTGNIHCTQDDTDFFLPHQVINSYHTS